MLEATLDQGRLALNEGRNPDAEAISRALLARDAANAEALHILSAARWGQGAYEEGLALIQLAIDLVPGAPGYWYGLAWGLDKLERLDEAFDACSRCLQLAPGHPEALNDYATLVRRTGRFDEALAFYERMAGRGVPIRGLHLHRAVVLAKLGRYEASIQAFRQSIAEEGCFQSTPWEFSGPLLMLKHFREGWRNYEHRFDAPALLFMDCARLPGVPRWQGEPLAGKTILVHRDQGLGDQVMFASMIPDLIERGAHVRIDVLPPLRSLFAQSFPAADIVSVDAASATDATPLLTAMPDFEAPLGSLATVLRNDLGAFPGKPYLAASASKRQAWEGRLESADLMAPGLLRVGVVWTVNPNPGNYGAAKRVLQKQMQLARMAPLALDAAGGATALVSLSNNPVPEANGFKVHDFSALLTDFHETAALADLMDVVVTVDTSVAHVAAALGKETWVLLPYRADWRWGADDETSYWYPHARLFRQSSAGDWDGVMERVAKLLSARLKDPGIWTSRTNNKKPAHEN